MSVDLPTGVLVVNQTSAGYQKQSLHLSVDPDRIILYQKNVEPVCCNETDIRHEVPARLCSHELGHYLGRTSLTC